MLKIIPLSQLELEPGLEEQFWKAKVWADLESCNDTKVLKEAISALLDLCVKRQGVIKGLVKFQLMELGRSIQLPAEEMCLPAGEDEEIDGD
jgi:hypothetical protein